MKFKLSDKTIHTLVITNSVLLFCIVLIGLIGAIYKRDLLESKLQTLWESEAASSQFLEMTGITGESQTNFDYSSFNITIKSADLRDIKVQVEKALKANVMTDDLKKWYPAKFYHNKEQYDVKIRLKGDLNTHWQHPKKSWRVKFKKTKLFQGYRSIDLNVPYDKAYEVELVGYDVARENGLLVPDAGFAHVTFNGVNFGTYTWIEKYGPEMLEKQRYPVGEIIRQPNIWTQTRMNGFGIKNYTDFSGSFQTELLNPEELNPYYDRWQQLQDAVKHLEGTQFESQIDELLNVEKFLTYNAITWMFGSTHAHGSDNLRWYLDTSTGLLEPILYDVNRYPILLKEFNDHKAGSWSFETSEHSPLFRKIMSVPKYQQRRNEILWKLLNDKQFDVAARCRKYGENMAPLFITGVGPEDPGKFHTYRNETLQILTQNRIHLREHLSFARMFVSPSLQVDEKPQLSIRLVPDSRNFINVDDLRFRVSNQLSGELINQDVSLRLLKPDGSVTRKLNTKLTVDEDGVARIDCKGFQVAAPIDMHLNTYGAEWLLIVELPQTSSESRYQPDSLTGLSLSFSNSVTKENIAPDLVHRAPLHWDRKFKPQIKSAPELQDAINQAGLLAEVKLGSIEFHSGEQTLKSNLVIPESFSITIPAGTTIKMKAGVSFLSYSPLNINGTADEPVRVIPTDEENWGVFAVVNAKSESRVKHLHIRGGSETYLNGAFLSGQLCFYHSNVSLNNCMIENGQADDGLNVKKAHINVSNCLFRGNSSDGFDADWTTGEIKNCVFIQNLGDGLDFSGSQVTVRDCLFQDNADKGISVGERSNIDVLNNVIRGNPIGLASKDQSAVNIVNSVLKNNQQAVAAYQKKQLFGGAKAHCVASLFWENQTQFMVDEVSTASVEACGAEEWNLESTVGSENLLSGPVADFYQASRFADVPYQSSKSSSPFLIENDVSFTKNNGQTESISLKGKTVGLSHPITWEPWLDKELKNLPE